MDASTTTYGVTGLTCGHCVAAVTEEVGELPGVQDVQVDLAAGGTSTLRILSEGPIDRAALQAAITEAGESYRLADA